MGLFSVDKMAIDIGSYSVKGVVLSSKNELKKFAAVPTPPGAIEGGIVRNPEQVRDTILKLWKTLGVKENTSVISSIPGQHIFVRQINLPLLKKNEMDQAVRFQSESQIPIPPSDVVLDYSVVASNKAAKQSDVLVVATRKSVVQQMVYIFTQAKLQPKIFDTEALALARILLKKSKKPSFDGLDLVASIGAAHTHICLFEGDLPRFTRSIPFGGQRFTKAIAMERSISLEEAEERKLAGELPEEVNTLMDDLASELRRSIDFFQSQNKDAVVKQVLLAGGCAQMNNLQAYLSRRLGIPIGMGDPTEQVKVPKRFAQAANLEVFRTSFAPVLGLAVRGLK